MHHNRRRSGHGSTNTSMTDVRKAVTATDPNRLKRPTTLNRRVTPVSAQKLGRNPRDREREWQDSLYDERESFPQFWQGSSDYTSSSHALYAADFAEPRDIIPRASPSRPSSTYFSPPTTPSNNAGPHHSSAISALRSLTVQPPSPPSPSTLQPNLWPFSKSAATSPSTSYSRNASTTFFPSTYDGGHAATAYGYNASYNYSTSGMDRPLPTRRPTGYARPKSIELVTPMVGR